MPVVVACTSANWVRRREFWSFWNFFLAKLRRLSCVSGVDVTPRRWATCFRRHEGTCRFYRQRFGPANSWTWRRDVSSKSLEQLEGSVTFQKAKILHCTLLKELKRCRLSYVWCLTTVSVESTLSCDVPPCSFMDICRGYAKCVISHSTKEFSVVLSKPGDFFRNLSRKFKFQ